MCGPCSTVLAFVRRSTRGPRLRAALTDAFLVCPRGTPHLGQDDLRTCKGLPCPRRGRPLVRSRGGGKERRRRQTLGGRRRQACRAWTTRIPPPPNFEPGSLALRIMERSPASRVRVESGAARAGPRDSRRRAMVRPRQASPFTRAVGHLLAESCFRSSGDSAWMREGGAEIPVIICRPSARRRAGSGCRPANTARSASGVTGASLP